MLEMVINMKKLLLLYLLCISIVFAEDVDISWTNSDAAEECIPATPLPIEMTRIWKLVTEVEPTQTSYTISSQKPGEYVYAATHVDISGAESRLSGTANKVVTSFKASAGSIVYQVVTIRNGLWALPIGTLLVDTECILDQNVNGKHAVPQDNVDWSPGSTARPPLVVADCI
jgi:hypothetical protein